MSESACKHQNSLSAGPVRTIFVKFYLLVALEPKKPKKNVFHGQYHPPDKPRVARFTTSHKLHFFGFFRLPPLMTLGISSYLYPLHITTRKIICTQYWATYGLNGDRRSYNVSAQILSLLYFRSVEPVPYVFLKISTVSFL